MSSSMNERGNPRATPTTDSSMRSWLPRRLVGGRCYQLESHDFLLLERTMVLLVEYHPHVNPS